MSEEIKILELIKIIRKAQTVQSGSAVQTRRKILSFLAEKEREFRRDHGKREIGIEGAGIPA